MKKEEIYRKLVQRYASESPSVLREASYNLALAGVETEAGLNDRAAQAIARIKNAQARPSPLAATAAQVASKHLSSCPVCKSSMELVKLLEDREVYYCPDHRIVQPLVRLNEPTGE